MVQTDKQKYAIGENIQVDYQWLVTDAGADHYNIYIDSLDDLAGSTKETAFTIKKPLEEGVYSVIVQAVNSENQILDTNYTRIGVERETAGTETLKIENLTEATSLKNGQNVTAKIKVANTDTIAKDVTMMFCLYDEQSRMVDCVAVEKNIGSQQVGYLTGTLMLPQEGMYKAKIMVWDDPESMRSLMPYQEITMDKSK